MNIGPYMICFILYTKKEVLGVQTVVFMYLQQFFSHFAIKMAEFVNL